jgi:hypothetical protein
VLGLLAHAHGRLSGSKSDDLLDWDRVETAAGYGRSARPLLSPKRHADGVAVQDAYLDVQNVGQVGHVYVRVKLRSHRHAGREAHRRLQVCRDVERHWFNVVVQSGSHNNCTLIWI